jgi:ribosome-binding protein aMBF1 (putative translation factor)
MSQETWQVVTNKKQQKVVKPELVKFEPIPNRQNQIQNNNLNSSDTNYSLPNIQQTSNFKGSNTNQDWNTVTIYKTQPKPKIIHTQRIPSSVKLDESGDIIKIKKVSKEMAKAIVDARIAKKWTQIQLAHNACIDLKSLGEIEKSGCTYNPDIFNKITKALGIKVERNFDYN